MNRPLRNEKVAAAVKEKTTIRLVTMLVVGPSWLSPSAVIREKMGSSTADTR